MEFFVDSEVQEENKKDIGHDRENLPMPFCGMWKALRIGCLTKSSHET